MKSREQITQEIKDAFVMLKLPDTANFEEIRMAYKKLILEFHPDKAGISNQKLTDDERNKKFISIQSSYELLIKHIHRTDKINKADFPELSPITSDYWKDYFTLGRTGAALGHRAMITFESFNLRSNDSIIKYGSNQSSDVVSLNQNVWIAYSYLKEVVQSFSARTLNCTYNIFDNLKTLKLTYDEMRTVLSMQDDKGRTILCEMMESTDSVDQLNLSYQFFKFAQEHNYDFTRGFRGLDFFSFFLNARLVKFNQKARDEFLDATKQSFYQRARNCLEALFECKDLTKGLAAMKAHNNIIDHITFIDHCKQDIINRGDHRNRTPETTKLYQAIAEFTFRLDKDNYPDLSSLDTLEDAATQFIAAQSKQPSLKAPAPHLSVISSSSNLQKISQIENNLFDPDEEKEKNCLIM